MKKGILKFILLLAILLIGYLILKLTGIRNITPEKIREYILSFGVWTPIFYIIAYTFRPFFFIPASLLSLSGGLTFGPFWGTLYDLVGASLGAYLSFGLSLAFGRETIQRWIGYRIRVLSVHSEEHGFRAILILRLIPLIPFDAVSFGAGLSKVRFRDFALGTTIGMLPGVFAYNFLGHSLNHMFSVTFFLAAILVVLPILITAVYKWSKTRSSKE